MVNYLEEILLISDSSKVEEAFLQKQSELSVNSSSKIKSLIYLKDEHSRIGKVKKVTSGHFKIEGDGVEEFFMNITGRFASSEELTFQYVFIENILKKENLGRLQKLKRLKTINFSFNNLRTYLDLVKFENLMIHRLNISNNPVCSCGFLKFFVVYRFSNIKVFNGHLIKDKDMTTAKTLFSRFDKLLQRPSAPKKKGLSYKERGKLSRSAGQSLWSEALLANSIEDQFDEIFDFLSIEYINSLNNKEMIFK